MGANVARFALGLVLLVIGATIAIDVEVAARSPLLRSLVALAVLFAGCHFIADAWNRAGARHERCSRGRP